MKISLCRLLCRILNVKLLLCFAAFVLVHVLIVVGFEFFFVLLITTASCALIAC